jgi:hypothetical protein
MVQTEAVEQHYRGTGTCFMGKHDARLGERAWRTAPAAEPRSDALGSPDHRDALGSPDHRDALGSPDHRDALGSPDHRDALGVGRTSNVAALASAHPRIRASAHQ